MQHEPDSGELSHLLHALAAFLQEHRGCGDMDGGAEDNWICECGAVINRTPIPRASSTPL